MDAHLADRIVAAEPIVVEHEKVEGRGQEFMLRKSYNMQNEGVKIKIRYIENSFDS